MQSTEAHSYTRTAKILHWLIALAIFVMLCLGWSFDFLPKGETKFVLIQLHKSIGITILLLSIFRLIWRFLHRAPPLPATMPRWEQSAAHIGHIFLYVMMIGMPLSGWVMVSASPHNIPTILYGFVPWPNVPIAPENKEMVDNITDTMHAAGGYIIAVLAAGHAVVALKHHFISRDDILLRMAPKCTVRFLNHLRGVK